MTERWTITVPEEVADEVMAELDWGDSRSAWVVDAIEQKLAGGGREPVDAAALVDEAGVIDAADRDAAIAIVEHVADGVIVLKGELQADVYPEHPGSWGSQETWWRNIVVPLAEADVLERDAKGLVWLHGRRE